MDRAGRWAVSAAGPHGLDLDPAGARAFVACDGARVSILDLNNGREIRSVEIAGEPDAIWYNPARARLDVAIGRPGMIDVLDTLGVARVEQVITEEDAHTSRSTLCASGSTHFCRGAAAQPSTGAGRVRR